jgi:hypothetical protein
MLAMTGPSLRTWRRRVKALSAAVEKPSRPPRCAATEIKVDLEAHLGKLSALLELERAAEVARFAEAGARLSLQERDARGLAIAQVEPVEEGALSGRDLVTYARPGGAELGGAQIGSGSVVRVVPRRPGEQAPDAPSGVVARRNRAQLALVFDAPPPEWAVSGRVALELCPSPVAHERLAGAVRRLREDDQGKRWHGPLAGAPLRWEERHEQDPDEGQALNREQRQALALAESARDLALVHGPPGTGKTTVLVELIRRAAARGDDVLVSAPSNLAVDNLVERLVLAGVPALRLGHPARVLPAVLEHTLDERVRGHEQARLARELVGEALRLRARARKRKTRRGPGRFSEAREDEREARRLFAEARRLEDRAEADVLDRARVVCATLSGLGGGVLGSRRFALAVVDEATQAVEPAAFLALLRAERAALAGDHLQLPPTVLSAEAQAGGLAVSLFERLMALPQRLSVTLAEQYRMNEQIMRFPSDALYGGRLRAHPAVAQHHLDGAPLELVDTAGRGFEEETPPGSDSKRNPGEAELAEAEVARLLGLGVPAAEVAVIAPYDAQVSLLRGRLALQVAQGLEVDTVDGFQGREKEAVVLSLVRSNAEGDLGFLADIRRMNVALTRARKKLVVIGDGATVARHPFYEAFLHYAQRIGAWRSAWER